MLGLKHATVISISCTQAVPQFQTPPLDPSNDMRHTLVVRGVLIVGSTVLALQANGLVREEMTDDGVDCCGDSEANDNNCSQCQVQKILAFP